MPLSTISRLLISKIKKKTSLMVSVASKYELYEQLRNELIAANVFV